MAKIDLAKRAEIGRVKSAKTREQLLGAARSLYAQQAIESVTVEDIVREAGVAKALSHSAEQALIKLDQQTMLNLLPSERQ